MMTSEPGSFTRPRNTRGKSRIAKLLLGAIVAAGLDRRDMPETGYRALPQPSRKFKHNRRG